MEASFPLLMNRFEGHVGKNREQDHHGTDEDPRWNAYPGFDGGFDGHALSGKTGEPQKQRRNEAG
jgi:hypothetical protein